MNCPKCTMPLMPERQVLRLVRFYDPGPDTECARVMREPPSAACPAGPATGSHAATATAAARSAASTATGSAYTSSAGTAAAATGGAFHFDADNRGQGRGYTWEIQHAGAFALAVVNLQPEQQIAAEAGAMVSMSANIDLHSEMKGGIFGALKRAVGGESAFVSTFTAKGGPGEVCFAPGAPGDVAGIEMNNQTFMVQSSSYLAGDIGLQVDTKFGGAKSWLGGEGLFVLQITGTGLAACFVFRRYSPESPPAG